MPAMRLFGGGLGGSLSGAGWLRGRAGLAMGVVVGVVGSAALLALAGCATSTTGSGTTGSGGAGSGAASTTTLDPRSQRLRDDHLRLVTTARDRVFPALVNIQVVTVEYWGGKETKQLSGGSGTIISPDGYVVTNAHVTDNGKKFRVILADKREADATLVGEDVWTDIAVLKINTQQLGDGALPVAQWGDSRALVVGDTVMAMGSPFFLSRTVTLGIVSNTDRVFTNPIDGQQDEMDWGSGTTGIFTNWIQHDALINPGNSGGPLVNLSGQIIGVNARGGSGTGFAVPSEQARWVAEQLIAHGGEVPRSQIGLEFRAIGRTPFTRGVLVNSVIDGLPAHAAGLRAGDLILSINGTPTTVRFPEQVPPLLRKVTQMPVGSPITIAYERAGVESTATVTTQRLQREQGERSALRLWGFSVGEITPRIALDRNLPSTDGVLVWGVRNGGPSDTSDPALRPGDIITSVNGQTITTFTQLVDSYRSIMSTDPLPEFVTLGFSRGTTQQVTVIKPRPDRKEDPPREVPKSWIGVATQPVLRDLATQLGHRDVQGFRVTRVYPGTLAANADLRVGDVIFSLNGENLSPRTMQDAGLFQRRVRNLPTQGNATLGVLRAGSQRLEVQVPLERTRIGPDEALRDQNRDFELSVRELTFFDRDDNRWDENVRGVMATGVERAGWAGLAGMIEGDLIQRVGDRPVTDIPSHRAAMEAVSREQPEKVSFLVLRRNRTMLLFAEPDWKPTVQAPPPDAAGASQAQ